MLLYSIFSNIIFSGLVAIIVAFLLVYFIIPRIIWVVNSKDLIDHPDQRSAHIKATPTMAGYSFFFTLVLMVFFIKQWDTDVISINLIAGLTIIFSIGLKDDLVLSTPIAKLGGETIAILFLLYCSCMQIESLDGFLGIYNLPFVLSILFTVLMLLTIVNAYNLIDGIDGLAAIVGIVIFSIYSLIFYATHLYFYFLLCLSLIGILGAYLRYNFSEAKKIFMGDTGSLIIGFCIGFFTLKFMTMDAVLFSRFTFNPENKLIIVIAILCIPLFDLVRVIGVRLLNNKSPFSPDRNHTHHVLLDSGLSHVKAALLLGFSNYFLVILLIYLSSHFNSFQMLIVIAIVFGLFLLVFYKLKENIKVKKVSKILERGE